MDRADPDLLILPGSQVEICICLKVLFIHFGRKALNIERGFNVDKISIFQHFFVLSLIKNISVIVRPKICNLFVWQMSP